MNQLTELHDDIDRRVYSIRENNADWLCGKGCDNCCKRLADVPQLTAAEWALLREGLTRLPTERLQAISKKMTAIACTTQRPVVCPLLDHATGACTVLPVSASCLPHLRILHAARSWAFLPRH